MDPFLLIGLGNPGKSYAGNRHNIGFMIIDRITEAYGFSKPAKKFGGQIAEGAIEKQKVYAFKPLGYMNTSGVPSAEAANFYKIPLERIIVIHDELDLPLGKLRVKRGGGNGGHNGLKSLDDHLGKDYWRVRVGIGHPLRPPKPGATNDVEHETRARGGDKDMVSDYVLSDFTRSERRLADVMVDETAKNISLLLAGGEAKFMSKIALEIKEAL
ncbi:MAG: aminoacyl-tRNA hydrolase [Pseudomonadota bacterium]|nr:aminoacyl-tRNA hydrolase [Pseudomonadota bacterium]MDE3037686.1 aminoacyl-tRNA hydrolase [Pseudomonadota bacterium]